jgi:hypothetical protein
MTDDEALVTFLLEKIAGDAQTARAMPHAIANLQSRWSPTMLLADCDAKARVVQHCVASIEAWRGDLTGSAEAACAIADLTMVLKLLALKYAHLKDYRERWAP